MLTIVIRHKHRVNFQEEWKVGDPRLNTKYFGLDPEDVIQVIAYGPELDYIRERFAGIPMAHLRQLCWIGSDAAFIANHLTD